MPLETCDWIDACDRPAHGMAGHPDKGVIPVCLPHVDAFDIPLITLFESEN